MCRYKLGFMKDGRVTAFDGTLYNNAGNSLVGGPVLQLPHPHHPLFRTYL